MAYRSIYIQNEDRYVNRNRANRLVKHGKAIWADETQRVIRTVDLTASLVHGPQFNITARRRWERCYRTAEAPIIAVTPEWLRSVGY